MINLKTMVAKKDITSFSARMIKLAEMGLDDKVLGVFQEAERRILEARKATSSNEVLAIREYVEGQKQQLLMEGYLNREVLEEQFGKGTLYIGHIALTGEIP